MGRLQRWLPNWLGGVSSTPGSAVAVYLSSASLALASSDLRGGQLRTALRSDPLANLTELPVLLKRQCQSLGVGARDPCNLVLAPELYSLALVERPDVPEDELREAVRWRLQEVLDYPVDRASLDVFPLPESANRDRPMVFVAALKTETLKKYLDGCRSAGLQVVTVDISELALRNLVHACHPDPDRGVGLLRLTPASGVITISRGEELFLSRRMQGLPGEFSSEAWAEYRERLLLQVQRSIDYYESAMGQPPCNGLIVATMDDWHQPVSDYLSEMLPVPNRSLVDELGELLSLRLHNPEPHELAWDAVNGRDRSAITAALPALGGLLRRAPEAVSGAAGTAATGRERAA